MIKKIITGITLIGVLALIVFVLMKNKEKNETEISVVAQKNTTVLVKVGTVKLEDISQNFSTNGNFEPMRKLTFSAEKPGKITKILVKEGSYVSAGQTLAIVRSDFINIGLQTAEAVYKNALNDYARFENAFKTGGVTKQQLDAMKLQLTTAESNYKNAKINASDVAIKAPFSGTINKKFIEIGDILASMPPTPLFEIVNTSKLKLKVTVNESQVTALKVGDSVKITTTVFPNKEFLGKITFIATMADASLNFPVEIEVENNSTAAIKAGMYGTANFITKKQKMLVVPRKAYIGSVNENEVFVYLNGIAKLKKVTSGKIIGDKVQILSGLNEGEQVVITGQINLKDGTKVEILK